MGEKALGFSDNHLRSISITLGKLAQFLCQIEDWADGRVHHAPLFQETNALTPEQRKIIREEVQKIFGLIAKIQDTLPLEPTIQSVHKNIWATCAVLREWVIELESRYMARCGPFDQAAAEYLDPRVKEIESRLRRISGVVSRQDPEK